MKQLAQNLAQNRWVVCLTAALFFFYEFFQVNMFNALDVHLMRDLQIDGALLSWISSAYFYGVILLLIPAGIILDRFSASKIILVTMLTSIAGTALFSIADSFTHATLGRFIVGVTAGPFALIAVLKLASGWFKNAQMAFITGLIVSIGMLAGVFAQAPFNYLVQLVGWREALWVNIGIGFCMFGLMYYFISDRPKNAPNIQTHTSARFDKQFWKTFKTVFLTKTNWQCGLFAALTNLPIFLLGALWGGLYLTQAQGFTRMEASYITLALYLGMLIGSPFFGWLSDKIQSRKRPMLFGGCLCLLAILTIMQLDEPNFFIFLSWFLVMGFGSSAQILVYASVAEANPAKCMGQAQGLAAMLIMGAGAFFQPLLGILIKLNWDGTMVNQIPIYSPENYDFGISLIPTAIAIGLLSICFMKETYQSESLDFQREGAV